MGAWELFEGITRLLAGGLLAAAGTWKLNSTWAWRQVWLTSYQLLPTSLVAPVALLLPVAELTCGVAVLLGAASPGSLWAAAALYGVFVVALASAKLGGLEVPCGCIPWLERLVSWRVVSRNLVFLVALIAVGRHGLTTASVDGLGWWTGVVMTAGSVAAVLVTIELVRGCQRRRLIAALVAAANPGPGALVAPIALSERT